MFRAALPRAAGHLLRGTGSVPAFRQRQGVLHGRELVYSARFISSALNSGHAGGRARRFDAADHRRRRNSAAVDASTSALLSTKSADTSDKMYIVFTCCNCETRAVKGFAKSSYESGVVLVQCPGCKKRHVIADHLGWFGSEKNVEEVLAGKGEVVRRITDVDIEGLTVDDIAGKSGADELDEITKA